MTSFVFSWSSEKIKFNTKIYVQLPKATYTATHSSGVGADIRDSNSCVTAVMSMKIPCPLGLLECKAKAMETGVNFAWDVGVLEMIFECDSLISSEALNGSSEPPVAISNLVEGIQHQIRDFCGIQVNTCSKRGKSFSTYLSLVCHGHWWLCNLDRRKFYFYWNRFDLWCNAFIFSLIKWWSSYY